MAECHPPTNDVGSLILNPSSSHHHHHHHHHCRIWSSFSFRKLIASVSCGGSSISTKNKNPDSSKTDIKKPEPVPNPKTTNGLTRPKSEKLGNILNLPPYSFSSGRKENVEEEKDLEERRRKEVRLEELRRAVKLLESEKNGEERENGAKKVRSLAKEDGEARSTLAMLGAIPPLVALLDHHHDDHDECLIEALYALLNLGIGNDL